MEMAKRLYKIEYEGTVYVVGEGPFDAEDIAMKAIRDDASACGLDIVCVDIVPPEKVSKSWANALPFGDADNRTCAEWAKE
jgi:hypothetical protein